VVLVSRGKCLACHVICTVPPVDLILIGFSDKYPTTPKRGTPNIFGSQKYVVVNTANLTARRNFAVDICVWNFEIGKVPPT
jgi:hypothetical protein